MLDNSNNSQNAGKVLKYHGTVAPGRFSESWGGFSREADQAKTIPRRNREAKACFREADLWGPLLVRAVNAQVLLSPINQVPAGRNFGNGHAYLIS